jgi:hypothetical protein
MRLILAASMLLVCTSATAFPRNSSGYHAPKGSTVHVNGHVTKKGTYVAPSYRTAPNKAKVDNWSSKPNVNPYTGKAGTKDPYAAPANGH